MKAPRDRQSSPLPRRPLPRRIVFQGLGALGVAAALAACGGTGDSSSTDVSSGQELAKTSEVPVGGGLVLSAEKIVLTQPTKGEFKAFSAVCTHEGHPVSEVQDGQLVCPTHGSHFSIDNGDPVSGPASSPLSAVKIQVKNGQILAA